MLDVRVLIRVILLAEISVRFLDLALRGILVKT
jgi:hypothetical protein